MDVEVNLLQQKFNKIELEKAKDKKLHVQKQEERQNHMEDKLNKLNEIDQEIQSAFDRKSVFIKHLRIILICYLQDKENI